MIKMYRHDKFIVAYRGRTYPCSIRHEMNDGIKGFRQNVVSSKKFENLPLSEENFPCLWSMRSCFCRSYKHWALGIFDLIYRIVLSTLKVIWWKCHRQSAFKWFTELNDAVSTLHCKNIKQPYLCFVRNTYYVLHSVAHSIYIVYSAAPVT